MSLPGGIRTTLAVALLLIVGGALGGAYLMVVPSLERRLVAERLDELQSDAEATALIAAGARSGQTAATVGCALHAQTVAMTNRAILLMLAFLLVVG